MILLKCPDASRLPSGENAREYILSAEAAPKARSPLTSVTWRRPVTSQTRIDLSFKPTATASPFGENAMLILLEAPASSGPSEPEYLASCFFEATSQTQIR